MLRFMLSVFACGLVFTSSGCKPKSDSGDRTVQQNAQLGDPWAQRTLGIWYEHGINGQPKDTFQAAQWYRKAADQNDAEAQYQLAWLYKIGDGVPKDTVSAHAWFSIAAAQKIEHAQTNMEDMEKIMTPDQKAEAMKLARELFEKMAKK